MFGDCRCFIFNYFHQCWNWKYGVFTCVLWLVKAYLIPVFFANPLCTDFLMPYNLLLCQSTQRKWSFSSSTKLLWWNFKNIVIFKTPVSVRYGRSCLKGQKQRGRLRQKLLCICLKECMTSPCKEKHFIKPASPISVSLSPCLQNQLQQRHSLLPMRFLIIRFLSLEGITFPQSTGWNPKHKLWDPYEGNRCFQAMFMGNSKSLGRHWITFSLKQMLKLHNKYPKRKV